MFKLNEFINSKLLLILAHFIIPSPPQHIKYSSFKDFFIKQSLLFAVSNLNDIDV